MAPIARRKTDMNKVPQPRDARTPTKKTDEKKLTAKASARRIGPPTDQVHGSAGNGFIRFRAGPNLIASATKFAKVEGYNGAGSVARKALIVYLRSEGYYPREAMD